MLAGSIANAKLSNSSITIAGASTALGGSITADTIANAISTADIKTSGDISANDASFNVVDIAELTIPQGKLDYSYTVSGTNRGLNSSISQTYTNKNNITDILALGGNTSGAGVTTTTSGGSTIKSLIFGKYGSGVNSTIRTFYGTNQFITDSQQGGQFLLRYSLSAGTTIIAQNASPTITLPSSSGTLLTTNDTITNSQLANSSITIAGASTTLGGSITADTIANAISTADIKTSGDISANDASFNYIDANGINLHNLSDDWGDSVTIGFTTDEKQRRGEIGYWTGQGNTSTSDNEGLRFTAKGNFSTRTDMSILDVNGYVGIANINPTERLDVSGNIRVRGDISQMMQ